MDPDLTPVTTAARLSAALLRELRDIEALALDVDEAWQAAGVDLPRAPHLSDELGDLIGRVEAIQAATQPARRAA